MLITTSSGLFASASNPGVGWIASGASGLPNTANVMVYWKNDNTMRFAKWQVNANGAIVSSAFITSDEYTFATKAFYIGQV